jgi:anti-anti-sigma factor
MHRSADTSSGAGFTSRHLNEILVVSLHGRVTAETGAALIDWLTTTPRAIPHVVVNVEAVTSFDHGGADALLDAFVATALRDGTLALTGLPDRLRKSLHREGVLPVIDTYTDDSAAVELLASCAAACNRPTRSLSLGDVVMLDRPSNLNAFEFVRIAALRASQLMRGSAPRVSHGMKPVTTAMREVAAGKVRATPRQAPRDGS